MTERRLLVVEDNELIRGKLETFFTGKGFVVQVAADLTSALARLGGVSFDAIITEFLLPGGTCEALGKQLRAKGLKGRTALVVLASSKQSLDSVEDARRVFDAVLLKPFKALELFKTVDDLVSTQARGTAEPAPFAVEIDSGAGDLDADLAFDPLESHAALAPEPSPRSARPIPIDKLLLPEKPQAAPIESAIDTEPIPLEIDLDRSNRGDALATNALDLEIEPAPPESATGDIATPATLDNPLALDPNAPFDAPVDLEAPIDLGEPVDLGEPIDLGEPVDLGEPIDLGPPIEVEPPVETEPVDLVAAVEFEIEPEAPPFAVEETVEASDDLSFEVSLPEEEPSVTTEAAEAPPALASADDIGGLAPLPKGTAPLATGDLEEFPFAQLLLDIFHRGTTGVLALTVEAAEKRIYFVNGIPVYAESTILSENLGQFLLSSGVIQQPDYQRALEWMQQERIQQGEAFVRLGLFSYADLLRHLRRQIREKIVTTFNWPSASYQLFEDAHFVESKLIFEMQPVDLIHEGIGRFLTADTLAAEFAGYVDAGLFVRRTDQLQQILSPIIALMPSIDVDACFSGERRLSDLRALTGLSDASLGQLLRALLVVGAIEMVEAASQATIAEGTRDDHSVIGESIEVDEDQIIDAQPVNSPPRDARVTAGGAFTTADANAIIDRVTRDYLRTKTNDYYKVLGVLHDASVRAIEDAYLALVEAYHPDKFRDIEVLGIRSKAKEVFLRVSTAYGILSDVSARRSYDQSLSSRVGDVATKDKTIGAQLEFQAGERALGAGDFTAAEGAFERAVALNEKEPVYHLYLGWTRWNLSAGDAARREQAKSYINRGIAMNPIIDVGYLFLGRVLKTESKIDEAREMFERALVFNPDNADAANEAAALQSTVPETTQGGALPGADGAP